MFKKIFSNELMRGSLILFFMINIYNFLNYLFHFLTARVLGRADYGTLAALMSLVYIFTIPGEAIQTFMSRYTSTFNVKQEFGKMHYVLSRVIKKGFRIAFFLFLLFALIAIPLAYFIPIRYFLFFVTGILLFGVFLVPAVRGVLQGRKKFSSLGVNMILESLLKIIVAVFFILLGFRVFGAILGLLFGTFVSFFLSFLSIREVVGSQKEPVKTEDIYVYSIPIFFAMLAIVLIYSLDIILAKVFFPAEIAGEYAVVSMIAKMIFFGTYPISKVLFPLSSEGFETGKRTNALFLRSFFLISLLAVPPLLIMIFFPSVLIKILFGAPSYEGISMLLLPLGIAMTLLSFTNLAIVYAISVHRLRKSYLLFIFVGLEFFLFAFFHGTLKQFSIAFLIVNALLFFCSFFFIKRSHTHA